MKSQKISKLQKYFYEGFRQFNRVVTIDSDHWFETKKKLHKDKFCVTSMRICVDSIQVSSINKPALSCIISTKNIENSIETTIRIRVFFSMST